MKRLYSIPVLALCLTALMATGCQKQIDQLKARNELNKGVKAFSAGEFDTAAERFETAMGDNAISRDPVSGKRNIHDTLSDRIGERAVSRIFEMCTRIKLDVRDYRKRPEVELRGR